MCLSGCLIGISDFDTDSKRKKREIRERFLTARDDLTAAYKTNADREIISKLSYLTEYKDADVVFCFVGVGNEIDTMPFIIKAIQSGKRVCAPRCISNEIMEAFEITGIHDLERGIYGLLEPVEHCKRVDAEDICLAVVPCLACDPAGYRLGYGHGYYDKYLTGKGFCKVVLCRDQAIIDMLPASSGDIPADIVITEKQIFRTGN